MQWLFGSRQETRTSHLMQEAHRMGEEVQRRAEELSEALKMHGADASTRQAIGALLERMDANNGTRN